MIAWLENLNTWAYALLLAAFATIAYAAVIVCRHTSRDIDDWTALVDATAEPPAPGAGTPPRPQAAATPRRPPLVPGHHHGGLDMTIHLWRCGCIHYVGRRGELVDVMPCARPPDWDAELRRLTGGQP